MTQERDYQTISNILHTFQIQDLVLVDNNFLDRALDSTMFALRATVHATMQYMLAQLVFGHDSILKQCHDVDWESMKKRKQDLIHNGNAWEKKRI